MDPDKDVIDFKPNPLFAMKKELKEETGIGRNLCLRYQLYRFRPYLAFVTKLIIPFKKSQRKAPGKSRLRKWKNLT